YATDDAMAIRKSFAMLALRTGVDLPTWFRFRKKTWHQHAPWTDGLCSLFGSVQDELLSQWRVLRSDSLAHEFAMKEQSSKFEPIVVPAEPKLPLGLQRGKECEELAEEIKTIRHKRVRGGLTVAEIQEECSSFKIWKRVQTLSS